MKSFNTPVDEINNLGNEFYSQAYSIIDDLYNLAFWILLSERSAGKIILTTYQKAIYYYDKTKGSADWFTWMHRILINLLTQQGEYLNDRDKIKPELIDNWKIQPDSVNNLLTNFKAKVDEKKVLYLLNQIPKALLIPFIFSSINKISSERVSELLDIPKPVVALRIYKAKKLLFILISLIEAGKKTELQHIGENEEKLTEMEFREIAALNNNNLSEAERSEIINKINKNPQLKAELQVQEEIESLMKENIKRINAPERLKRKVKKIAERRFSYPTRQ